MKHARLTSNSKANKATFAFLNEVEYEDALDAIYDDMSTAEEITMENIASQRNMERKLEGYAGLIINNRTSRIKETTTGYNADTQVCTMLIAYK